MVKTEMNRKRISKGILLPGDKLKTLSIPIDVIGRLTSSNKNYLVIFIPKDEDVKISILPCHSKAIMKISVYLNEFSPKTVKSIAEIIYDLNIHTIHTSGLCFQDKKCCYEAYIEMNDNDINRVSFIREKFIKIDGCIGVDVEILEVSK
ncbi:MAG: hypothetical protein ACTSVI_12435 [Promethearchaeota archaeon]